MEKTSAMILAGGRGKRMADLSRQQRPKPILPFAGNFQVIDFTLSNCVNSQINDIAVLVDYQRSAMTEYLKQWRLNNNENRISILQPETGSYSGTASAVYENLDYLKKQGSERVLILAGDHIYKMDYSKMLAFHETAGADATVAVIRVPMEQASRFGTVSVESEGRIIEFVEKSSSPRSNLASMGIYIFNIDFLAKCLSEDAADPNSPHDFGYAGTTPNCETRPDIRRRQVKVTGKTSGR